MNEKWKLISSPKIVVSVVSECNMRLGVSLQTPGIVYVDKKGETTVRILEEFKRMFAPVETA